LSRDSITTLKLPQTKTHHNFWFIDSNGMIQSFPHRYKSKESISLLFLKVIFKEDFFVAQAACRTLKTTYHTRTFEPCSQKLWKIGFVQSFLLLDRVTSLGGKDLALTYVVFIRLLWLLSFPVRLVSFRFCLLSLHCPTFELGCCFVLWFCLMQWGSHLFKKKKLWKLLRLKATSWAHVVWKFQRKKNSIRSDLPEIATLSKNAF